MTVFENCTVVLDVKNVPFKEKNKLRLALLENGGNISYVINKEVRIVNVNDLSSNRQRSIQKLQVPVVGTQYVWSCLDQGHLLPLTEHNLTTQLPCPASEFLPPSVVQDKLVFCVTSEDAVEAYLQLMKELETEGFTKTHTLPPEVERLASYSLQQLLLEEKLNCSTLSQEVGVFVELVWTEALGSLNNILTVPVSRISLNDVRMKDEVKALLEEVNTLLPLRMIDPPSKHKLVSQKLDLCQLIRDIVNVSEATLGSPSPSSLGKYRALRCSIEVVSPQNPEFHVVSQLLQDRPVQIQQILRVSRGVELQLFMEDLGNIKPLLHSSSPSSFVGILSRGLLLPRVGVEQHGIERTDIGNLGGGIYFSDSLKTSVKYSKPSVTDGSRLLLVCEVALGRCKDLLKKDTTLTRAPDGYHSVHGVQRTPNRLSEFEDDEFVVYNTEQIRLKYVVQYSLEGDELKEFQPQINTHDDNEGLESTKNPLEEMNAGLLDSSGQKLPLQAVNVRCKLMDLLCQVIIFQTYTNQSAVPIEAKYVFPLEETAAVCGFEAFINGKHVIGKVKEKEQARKEYKQAIEKGHGAYLMDQDAPDVFTISVGNLPPGATVLIKVTFITELVVRSGSIIFSLSGTVAPWQQRDTLNQTTQATVEKIGVTELQSEGEFSLSMSIEMPYEIINLSSSHRIKTKRTDCKAVISTLPGQTLGSEGLQVSFSLSNIHMPRMWVENHPDKDSQACMLVFYPDFKSSGVSSSGGLSSVNDVVILLDSSKSMRGDAMLNARRIALQVLKSLDRSLKINIISFSTGYITGKCFFCISLHFSFLQSCSGSGGSTDLWRPLRILSLLPPCRGVRNILLLSDGHVQNQPLTLQLVRENSCHTRLFTCGLSLTANRHMLRALAQAGGGTYEYFDTKMKHTWTEKVRAQVQRMESPGCRSVAVKWQQFNPTAPLPVQAPSQLHALFSDCHTLVYGFVPHCTQATLFGDLSGQEIKTMVSTTELQKTKGTFLHKLTARAIIRDYEDGILANSEAEHEGKKAELKSYIIELSKEFSILSQFTSFVAIEKRDEYENIDKFRKKTSPVCGSPLPRSIGSWRPSRFEGSTNAFRGSLTKSSKAAPRPVAARQYEIPEEDLCKAIKGSFSRRPLLGSVSMSDRPPRPAATQVTTCMPPPPPPQRGAAYMSDRLPRPAASQVTTCMPPPPSVESLSSIRRTLPPSADAMKSRTGILNKRRSAPPPSPLSSYEPPPSDLLSFESVGFRGDGLDSLTKMSPVFCPTSSIVSSATEFATELYASTPSFYADSPHPPRLTQFVSYMFCVSGVKAHAEILRLMATLLVLQLIRVKKLEEPMYWEAVKRAVDWACRTDRQYPCVCSRLEIGRDWESSTRQLLGCDSPHPYSPLKPVLERRMDVLVM
uniref:Poly [ADP-ribose] polymerase n=1 Tax=Cyprinus carpio TaxID=7962 RepID=A0A8C1UVM7_CYPCA